MKYKKDYVGSLRRMEDDWHKRALMFWFEDDAPVPDKERGKEAFKRIVGYEPNKDRAVATLDFGDGGYWLFPDGWIYGWAFDGGSVGILVKHDE